MMIKVIVVQKTKPGEKDNVVDADFEDVKEDKKKRLR